MAPTKVTKVTNIGSYLKDETLEKTTQRIRPTIHSIIKAKRPEPIPKTKTIIQCYHERK